MIQKYRHTIVIALVLTLQCSLRAQHFNYEFEYLGFFDNREYFNPLVNDQTMAGSRVSAAAGYAFDENNRMMAGASYLYEFGSKGEWIAPDVIAYYQGNRKHLGIIIGAFPRTGKIELPLTLFTDTFAYYRPITEGILLQFSKPNFSHNLWIDWTGRQSYEKQESFLLGFSGKYQHGIFIWQHHFIMTHLAHTKNTNAGEHIRDNAGFILLPGLNLTQFTRLDSLTLSAGLLGSYDRLRNVYDFRVPWGFYAEAGAVFRGFGLQGTLYMGESQVITSGDGFYKSDRYLRADAFYGVSKPHLQAKVQCSLHVVPGVVDVSMSLVIRASIQGLFGSYQRN